MSPTNLKDRVTLKQGRLFSKQFLDQVSFLRKRPMSTKALTIIEGTVDFQPTNLMSRVLLRRLNEIGNPRCEKLTNPPKFLKAMGHDRSSWYTWQKMPGFKNWWEAAIEEHFTGDILRRVHAHHADLALNQRDSSTLKLFYERFDRDYKPTTATEHKVSGIRPPDAISEAQAVAASRKMIESITKEAQQEESPPGETEPANEQS